MHIVRPHGVYCWTAAGAGIHLVSAGILLFSSAPGLVTWTAGLWVVTLSIFGNSAIVAYLFILAAALSLMALFVEGCGRYFVWLVWLQFTLYLMSALGVIYSVMIGAYPDGYVPKGGAWFILNDQLPMLFFAIGHTVEFMPRLLRLVVDDA